MPPPAKKDLCMIVFDTHSSEKEKLLKGLLRISSYIQVAGSKDVYSLLLANTKYTENELNYPNVLLPGVHLDPEDVESCINSTESEEGDWLDAILVGIYYLEQNIEMAGVITLQLIYFTTLDSSLKAVDNGKVQEIIKKLNAYNIYLYIVGPNVELPFVITSKENIMECMKQLQVDESNQSLFTAKYIIQNVNKAVMCPLNVGLHLLFSFKEPRGSQPWNVPLTFGTQLSLPANTSKIYKPYKVLRLIEVDKNKRKKQVLHEDETIEVKFTDMVRGILRHGKFVEITNNKMFRLGGARSFDVLGFTEKKFIPETYIRGTETYCVLPDESNEETCKMFCVLVQILLEQNKYVVTSRIYYNNNKPKFFVLIPQVNKAQPPNFLMAELPYSDDVQEHITIEQPSLSDEKINLNVLQYCESLDISNNSKISPSLGPNMLIELTTNKFINATASKFLKREFEFCYTDYFSSEEPSKYAENLKEFWPEPTEQIS